MFAALTRQLGESHNARIGAVQVISHSCPLLLVGVPAAAPIPARRARASLESDCAHIFPQVRFDWLVGCAGHGDPDAALVWPTRRL